MGNIEQKETQYRLKNKKLQLFSSQKSVFFSNYIIYKVKGDNEMVFSCKTSPINLHHFEKSKELSHPNLLHTLALQAQWTDIFCSDSANIVFFEYSQWNLKALIDRKKRENAFFKENELILLLKGIINVLAYFQKQQISHGNINPCLIFYDNKLDAYKILDQELINGYLSAYNLSVDKDYFSYYSSPELLITLQEKKILMLKNSHKNDVFSLGMCILEAATLLDNKNLYDRVNLKILVIELEKRMKIVEEMYSYEFYKTLESLLILEPSKRSDPAELANYLKGNKIIQIKAKPLNDRELPKIIEEINIDYSCRRRVFDNYNERDCYQRKLYDDEVKCKSLERMKNIQYNTSDYRNKNNLNKSLHYINQCKSQQYNTVDNSYFKSNNYNLNESYQSKRTSKPNCFNKPNREKSNSFYHNDNNNYINTPKKYDLNDNFRIRTTNPSPLKYKNKHTVFSERTKKFGNEFEDSLGETLNRMNEKLNKVLMESQLITSNSYYSIEH